MKGPRWTEEEKAFLRDNYAAKGGEWCAEKLGRPLSSTMFRASLLGVARKRRAWRESENNFLRQHYHSKGVLGCAKELGRSVSNIQSKVKKLGLGRSDTSYGIYKRLEPIIEEMYMAGCNTSTISEVLGLNPNTLRVRVTDWGLSDVREMYRQDLAKEIAEKHGVKV